MRGQRVRVWGQAPLACALVFLSSGLYSDGKVVTRTSRAVVPLESAVTPKATPTTPRRGGRASRGRGGKVQGAGILSVPDVIPVVGEGEYKEIAAEMSAAATASDPIRGVAHSPTIGETSERSSAPASPTNLPGSPFPGSPKRSMFDIVSEGIKNQPHASPPSHYKRSLPNSASPTHEKSGSPVPPLARSPSPLKQHSASSAKVVQEVVGTDVDEVEQEESRKRSLGDIVVGKGGGMEVQRKDVETRVHKIPKSTAAALSRAAIAEEQEREFLAGERDEIVHVGRRGRRGVVKRTGNGELILARDPFAGKHERRTAKKGVEQSTEAPPVEKHKAGDASKPGSTVQPTTRMTDAQPHMKENARHDASKAVRAEVEAEARSASAGSGSGGVSPTGKIVPPAASRPSRSPTRRVVSDAALPFQAGQSGPETDMKHTVRTSSSSRSRTATPQVLTPSRTQDDGQQDEARASSVEPSRDVPSSTFRFFPFRRMQSDAAGVLPNSSSPALSPTAAAKTLFSFTARPTGEEEDSQVSVPLAQSSPKIERHSIFSFRKMSQEQAAVEPLNKTSARTLSTEKAVESRGKGTRSVFGWLLPSWLASESIQKPKRRKDSTQEPQIVVRKKQAPWGTQSTGDKQDVGGSKMAGKGTKAGWRGSWLPLWRSRTVRTDWLRASDAEAQQQSVSLTYTRPRAAAPGPGGGKPGTTGLAAVVEAHTLGQARDGRSSTAIRPNLSDKVPTPTDDTALESPKAPSPSNRLSISNQSNTHVGPAAEISSGPMSATMPLAQSSKSEGEMVTEASVPPKPAPFSFKPLKRDDKTSQAEPPKFTSSFSFKPLFKYASSTGKGAAPVSGVGGASASPVIASSPLDSDGACTVRAAKGAGSMPAAASTPVGGEAFPVLGGLPIRDSPILAAATARGSQEAVFKVAETCLSSGQHQEAVVLLRLVAHEGYAPAQAALADCYEKGIGVVQSMPKAKKWRDAAAHESVPTPKALVSVPSVKKGDKADERGSAKDAGSNEVKTEKTEGSAAQGMHGVALTLGSPLAWVGVGGRKKESMRGNKVKQKVGEDAVVSCVIGDGVKGAPKGSKVLRIVRHPKYASSALVKENDGKSRVGVTSLISGWIQGIQKSRKRTDRRPYGSSGRGLWGWRQEGHRGVSQPVGLLGYTDSVAVGQDRAAMAGGVPTGGVVNRLADSPRALQQHIDLHGFDPTSPPSKKMSAFSPPKTPTPAPLAGSSGSQQGLEDFGGGVGDSPVKTGDFNARESMIGF